MKTAAKIFIILGMVSSVLSPTIRKLTITGEISEEARAIVTLIWWVMVAAGIIVSLVFGILALVRLGKAKCKADIPVWLGVCVLLFVNLIGGILMLCLKDEHLMPKELAEYKKLLDDGIITQEEYDAKAASINK